jgi:hypothetical protein
MINKIAIISVVVGVVVIIVSSIVGFAVLPRYIRNKIEEVGFGIETILISNTNS